MKKFLLASIILMFISLICFGQSATTGAIKGTVKSADGEALPGILVTATSPSLIGKKTAISNETGGYRFVGLAPGIYKFTYELEGMNTVTRESIKVSLSSTSSINITMNLKTITESVVVTGKAPTVDTQTTTKSANMDLNFLELVPALRTLGSYFNFTPGVTGNTAHGGSVRDTSFNLDGLNLSDPVVGTQGVFFGLDIMEEISVSSGGLSAEHGQTRGATLNVVSKSGGNKFSGTASAYYRHESLQSDNTTGTALEGEKSGYVYELEPGITLGGPVVKDKLWFFTNFSFNQREQFVSGFPYDKEEEVGISNKRPYPYLKFTLQTDQNNKFTFSYNYSDILYENRGASRYETEATTRSQTTPTHVGNFQWMRQFGSNMYMNFKIGGYYSLFKMNTKNDETAGYDYLTNLSSGSYGFSDYNDRHRLQSNLDATVFIDDLAGSHEMKIGGEFMYVWQGRELIFSGEDDGAGFNRYYQQDYYGPYRAYFYAPYKTKTNMMNIALFVNDVWNVTSNLTFNIGARYERQAGFIPVQDDPASVNSFAHVGYPQYTFDRTVTEQIDSMTWNSLSPRASFIYDLFSDGKTLLKGSFARYYSANITQYFSGANPNGFASYTARLNPDSSVAYLTGIGTPGNPKIVGYGDHGISAPHMDEVTVSIEKELFDDWSVSLRYIKKWDRNLLEDVNDYQIDMDALMDNGDLNWTNWTPVTTTDTYNNETVTFYDQIDSITPGQTYIVNPPGAKRDYDGIELVVNKRYSNGWQMNASYVYSNSRGLVGTGFSASNSISSLYENPNTHINGEGRFPLERRHQFKLTGVVRGPWGINMGTYFRYMSGGRYTRRIMSLDLGLELTSDATINAEKRGSQSLPDFMALDLKIEKSFKLGPINLRAFVDIFNVLNANKATTVVTSSSSPTLVYQEMTAIQTPRIFRFGAKIEF